MSFVTGHFGELRQNWWHGRPSSAYASPETDGLPLERQGLLAAYDLEAREWMWRVDCDSPAGFAFLDDQLFVASMHGGRMFVFDLALEEVGRVAHRLMNDLHTVVPVGDRLLVVSSGIDAVLELTQRGELTWSWWATEHGYEQTPSGLRRRLDRNDDYRLREVATANQSTHINCALPWKTPDGSDCILATLFHQGELVSIDPHSGKLTVLLDGMSRPHNPRKRTGGWIVCSSGTDSVVLLDDDFWIEQILSESFNWVQDAIPLDDDHILIADANNSRLAIWSISAGSVVDQIEYDRQWKVYQLEVVSRAWAHAVGSADDPRGPASISSGEDG